MRDYKKIKVWQIADELVVEVYNTTKHFPKDELYGLTAQLRRAAVSVPSNIAEGASRQHKKDYLQFLYIARGSLAETEYLIYLSNKLNYITDEAYAKLSGLCKEVQATLFGLIKSVESEL